MNRYRFEVSANDFLLKTHFATTESGGIEYCRRYMTQFQKKVANVPMKVVMCEREKQKDIWNYQGKPYLYKKTLIRKPLQKKDE